VVGVLPPGLNFPTGLPDVFSPLAFSESEKVERRELSLAAVARLRCAFPQGGRYTIQLWFYQEQGSDILKAELPFSAIVEGE
jgi:hypothetical protein